MARPPRSDPPGAWHHVTNRGADRQDIFSGDADRRRFEALLGEASERCGIEVHAYCLMHNHFHLLVHCPAGGLSQAMHHISSHHAAAYNVRTGRDGALLRGRFKSVLVEDDPQLLQASRYVHRNPLSFTPMSALANYRWSSLGVYVGLRRPAPWLHTDVILSLGGSGYRQYVEEAQSSDDAVVPEGVAAPTCAEIEAAVCRCAGVAIESVRRPATNRRNDPRTLAICLALELRAADASVLAERYGAPTRSALRTQARRGRVLAETDDAFARLRMRAIRELRESAGWR